MQHKKNLLFFALLQSATSFAASPFDNLNTKDDDSNIDLTPTALATPSGVNEDQTAKDDIESSESDVPTLSEVVINGIDDERELRNAHVFLTINDVLNDPIVDFQRLQQLIENGKQEIVKALEPFGYASVSVTTSLQRTQNDLSVVYDVNLNEVDQQSQAAAQPVSAPVGEQNRTISEDFASDERFVKIDPAINDESVDVTESMPSTHKAAQITPQADEVDIQSTRLAESAREMNEQALAQDNKGVIEAPETVDSERGNNTQAAAQISPQADEVDIQSTRLAESTHASNEQAVAQEDKVVIETPNPALDDDANPIESARARLQREIEHLRGKLLTEIRINGIEDEQQRRNAMVFLTLNDEVEEQIDQPDYVNYLIEKGEEEIATSQQPFGFYNIRVTSAREFSEGNLIVVYDVNLNEPSTLDDVKVSLKGEAVNDEPYVALIKDVPLKVGDVLNHALYEEYKQQFLSLATKRGYFSGEFDENAVYVRPEEKQADVVLDYDSGNRYTYRSVTFNDVPLNDDLLARFVQFDKGDPYLASDISQLQQDLQGSGYFKQTFIGSEQDQVEEVVDVEAQLEMNKPKRYAIGIGYSTDSGIRGKFDFDHRYINRRGHNFSSSLYVSQKDSMWDNIYRIPADNPTTDYYFFRFGGKIKDDTYDQKQAYIEGGYNFRLGRWEHRYSMNALYEDFTIGVDADEVVLLFPRGQWTYTSTDNRLNPDSGFQAKFELLGGSDVLVSDVSFAQTNADFRYIQKINDRNRVTLRSDLGATWTDDFHSLPSSLRYFAGGDRSIRGYAYEIIGERDKNGDNLGGRYIATANAEYEYFYKPNWAAAAFVDVGDTFTDDFNPVYGAGVGVHWQSPVGPIKLDIGHGFDDTYGDDYRLHIGIGAELDL